MVQGQRKWQYRLHQQAVSCKEPAIHFDLSVGDECIDRYGQYSVGFDKGQC